MRKREGGRERDRETGRGERNGDTKEVRERWRGNEGRQGGTERAGGREGKRGQEGGREIGREREGRREEERGREVGGRKEEREMFQCH